MATINPTDDGTKGDFRVFTWSTVTTADTCTPINKGSFRDRTVQVTGTFSGSTCVIQGSNDGTNWVTLTDPQGNALSFGATGLETIMEAPLYTRPSVSGGTTTGLTITICVGRSVR